MDTPLSTGPELLRDAEAVSGTWRHQCSIFELLARMIDADAMGPKVDVVAIGKSSREMMEASSLLLGERLHRQFTVCDADSASRVGQSDHLHIGEHPMPGHGSLAAGVGLVEFLKSQQHGDVTWFLVSGGASSLCVVPQSPVTLEDLHLLWQRALAVGLNITELNRVRAACSMISGGRVLRLVSSARSRSFLQVDNVVSGAEWVASGLTYEHPVDFEELRRTLVRLGLDGTPVGRRVTLAARHHEVATRVPPLSEHFNVVVGEPSMVLAATIQAASDLGYVIMNLGAAMQGDVVAAVAQWRSAIDEATSTGRATCVVGVGELTVNLRGPGRGGRCQQFVWLLAEQLATTDREVLVMATATDGRDFLEGVSGAWSDQRTVSRARALGFDVGTVGEQNDANTPLAALGQIVAGGHTGWNLCDIYLALVGAEHGPS